MKNEIPNPYPEQHCFFCGQHNDAGLKLRFYIDEETNEVSTEYLASPPFTGLGKILHGGIQGGLFDEIMGWTAHYLSGRMGVTTDLNIRFIKPAYLGRTLRVSCRISEQTGPRVHLEARIETSGRQVCSTATGVYHLLSDERFDAIIHDKNAE